MSMNPGATTRFVASTRSVAGAAAEVADGGDAVAGDRHVGAKPRRARAVDKAAAGNQHVVWRRGLCKWRGQPERR